VALTFTGLTAQAAVRSSWESEQVQEVECCEICIEIWGEMCGGYANCSKDCESCCGDWCKDLDDEPVKKQCEAVCEGRCKSYFAVSEILGLISTVSIILAAIIFALHAIALLVSFGPYERSEAKRSIKYVIIVLVLFALIFHIVNILYAPFRVPGGETTNPTCLDCSNIQTCSDYNMYLGYQDCILNVCDVHDTCYVDKDQQCAS